MKHRVGLERAVRIMITVLCTAGVATLGAQQLGRPIQTAAGAVVRANFPSISGLGPRLPLEVPPFERSVAASASTVMHSALFDGGDNHTFQFSTLALVLIGGLALLLVVR